MIKVKRVYDEISMDDGNRFLVERLWPRGIKKEDLKINGWLKDIAPSTELRKWFGHKIENWGEFRKRYEAELDEKAALLTPILEASKSGNVTLLYSAKDTVHNSAIILKEYIERLEKVNR